MRKRPPQTIPELYETLCGIDSRLDGIEGEVKLLRRGIENIEDHLVPRKDRVVSTRGPRFPVAVKGKDR